MNNTTNTQESTFRTFLNGITERWASLEEYHLYIYFSLVVLVLLSLGLYLHRQNQNRKAELNKTSEEEAARLLAESQGFYNGIKNFFTARKNNMMEVYANHPNKIIAYIVVSCIAVNIWTRSPVVGADGTGSQTDLTTLTTDLKAAAGNVTGLQVQDVTTTGTGQHAQSTPGHQDYSSLSSGKKTDVINKAKDALIAAIGGKGESATKAQILKKLDDTDQTSDNYSFTKAQLRSIVTQYFKDKNTAAGTTGEHTTGLAISSNGTKFNTLLRQDALTKGAKDHLRALGLEDKQLYVVTWTGFNHGWFKSDWQNYTANIIFDLIFAVGFIPEIVFHLADLAAYELNWVKHLCV